MKQTAGCSVKKACTSGWINNVLWLEGLQSEDMALARAPVAERQGGADTQFSGFHLHNPSLHDLGQTPGRGFPLASFKLEFLL